MILTVFLFATHATMIMITQVNNKKTQLSSRTLSGPEMFFCNLCIIFIKLFICSCIEAGCEVPVVGAVE